MIDIEQLEKLPLRMSHHVHVLNFEDSRTDFTFSSSSKNTCKINKINSARIYKMKASKLPGFRNSIRTLNV